MSNDGISGAGLTPEFVRILTGAQMNLFAFVCMLLGNRDEAKDVLQDTNVILIKHAGEYDEDRPFLPWAKAFAYNQVKAHLKRKSRSRLVFDVDLVNVLAEETVARPEEDAGKVLELLEVCMERLTPVQKELVQARYYQKESAESLAKRLKRSVVSVRVQTHRIRRLLRGCVEALQQQRASAAGGHA